MPAAQGLQQRLYELSTEKRHKYGAVYVDEHGNVFRYAKAGASDIPAATLVQATAAYTTNTIVGKNSVPASTTDGGLVAGTKRIKITPTVNLAENELGEGHFAHIAGTGGAISCPLWGHAAQVSGTAGYFQSEQAFPVALNGGTGRSSVYPPLFKDLVAALAPPSKPVLGVTTFDITAGTYFWLQTQGVCIVRVDSGQTPVEGRAVIPSATTAGAVDAVPVDLSTITTNGNNSIDPIGRVLAYNGAATIRHCFIHLLRP